ncbi:MAG: metallophosphoesterase [Chloroflexi bacterium]|nr:metallophosphoesterase [Chloroflexota bacterium]
MTRAMDPDVPTSQFAGASNGVVEKAPVAPEKKGSYWWSGLGMFFGLGVGLASYAYWHEPLNIDFEHLTIHLPNAKGRIPVQGLRILHLSDTHFQGSDRREHAKIEKIRRLTADLEYDLLIHTGDFWHLESGLPNILSLLDAIPQPRLGSYGVFGNHDYTHYDSVSAIPRMWQTFRDREAALSQGQPRPLLLETVNKVSQFWRFGRYIRNTPLDMIRTGSNNPTKLIQALQACGMQILHNRGVHLYDRPGEADGIDLYLAGVEDVQEGRPHLGDSIADRPIDVPVILLSHNPDIVESPQIDAVDLVLAGHTHGGQIVLPLWGPAHTQAQYLARANVAGYWRRGNTQVYITRGIGEGIPLRFGARPQITLITVKA